jgi:hypothetical protein
MFSFDRSLFFNQQWFANLYIRSLNFDCIHSILLPYLNKKAAGALSAALAFKQISRGSGMSRG